MKKVWGCAIAVALVPIVLTSDGTAVAAPPDGEPTRFEADSLSSMAVDGPTGRVFVSADDKVVVFDAAGEIISTIEEMGAPRGMVAHNGRLYVVDQAEDEIVEITTDTLSEVRRWPMGRSVQADSPVVLDGGLWLFSHDALHGSLLRLDLTSGSVTVRSTPLEFARSVQTIPGDPARLFAQTVFRRLVLDITSTPAVVEVSSGDYSGGAGAAAVIDSETVIGTTTHGLTEIRLRDLGSTGHVHPGADGPVASTAARGGLTASMGGEAFTHGLEVRDRDDPDADFVFDVDRLPTAIAFDAGGARVYAITWSGGGSLHTFDLVTDISVSTTPGARTGLVTGIPARLPLEGTGAGSVERVLLAGSELPLRWISGREISVDVPAQGGGESVTLQLESAFGDAQVVVDLAPSTGAVLTGRVHTSPGFLADNPVNLLDEHGAVEATTTTDDEGRYSFSGLALRNDLSVSVPLPDGNAYRSRLTSVTPNESTVLDVYVVSQAHAYLEQHLRRLPPGRVTDLLVDPATERVFVAVGDEISVHDPSGDPIGRIPGVHSVAGLSLSGGHLWAVSPPRGQLVEIDPVGMAEVRRIDVGRSIRWSAAVVDQRAWFADVSLEREENGLVSMALPDGDQRSSVPCDTCAASEVAVIAGASSFLEWTTHSSGRGLRVRDASDGSVEDQVSFGGPIIWDVVADAGVDRLWPDSGIEVALSTLQPTGVEYQGGEGYAVARADVPGSTPDVLALGNRIFRVGQEAPTHQLRERFAGGMPADRAIGLSPDGERVYVATESGELTVTELAPRLVAMTPMQTFTPREVELEGFGLGDATALTLDGTISVPFERAGPSNLSATLPALTVGPHSLVVTTSWGASQPFAFTTVPRPAPVILSLAPNEGSTARATSAVIIGEHLVDVAAVRVGDDAVPFTSLSETRLGVEVPPREPGSAPIVVETAHGVSTASVTFAWFAPPAIDEVERGPFDDPEWIEVTGSGFDRVHLVEIDGVAVDFYLLDPETLGVWAPAHAPGVVPLTVTTPTDAVSVPITYVDPPVDPSPPAFVDQVSVAGTYQPLAGEFTGDGVDDVFWYAAGRSPDSMWRFEPDGRSTGSAQSVNGTYRPVVGEFTGDGVDDILWYAPGTAADSLWDFNPDGSRTTRSVSQGGSLTPVAGDFTGDGVDDVFWYGPGSAADSLWDFNPIGPRTSKVFSVTGTGYRPVVGDLTGDRVDDIAWYAPGAATDSVWDFNPGGTRTTRSLHVNGVYAPVVGDLTGDDVDDVLWYAPGSGADFLWDFAEGGTSTSRPLAIPGSPRLAAADLTGGGVTDLVLHGPGQAPDALWFMSPVIR